MSWKSVGGINYKQKNQYVRATNFQIDSVVPTQSIGKKDTTAYVEGDLFFQDGVKLYSTRKQIDSNGLYAHYPFNSMYHQVIIFFIMNHIILRSIFQILI